MYPFHMLSTFNNQQARYRSTTNQKQPDPPSRAVIGLKHNRQRVLCVLMIRLERGRRQRIAVVSQSAEGRILKETTEFHSRPNDQNVVFISINNAEVQKITQGLFSLPLYKRGNSNSKLNRYTV